MLFVKNTIQQINNMEIKTKLRELDTNLMQNIKEIKITKQVIKTINNDNSSKMIPMWQTELFKPNLEDKIKTKKVTTLKMGVNK